MTEQGKEQLAEWLLKYDEQTLRLALMYATNYLKYGVDVTEKWCTAVQQQNALKNVEKHGYVEGQNSVGIVRCKDCKHFEPDGIYTMCYRHNGLSQGDEWFCADGERRTE